MVADYLCYEECGDDAEDHGTSTRYLLALWVCYSCRKGAESYPEHTELVQRCGSPVAALQELLYGDPDLPDGAVPHLLGLPKKQRGVLDHLLKELKGVFAAELPKYVPPDRGLGDVHEIAVKPGTEPIARKMYRHSPKEQLLIK